MDRARRLGRRVARNATRETELFEQPLHAACVLRYVRVDLAVGPFEPGIGDDSRPAMTRAGDVDHVAAARLDDPVEMDVDKVQPRCRPPMAEQARLDVREFERL